MACLPLHPLKYRTAFALQFFLFLLGGKDNVYLRYSQKVYRKVVFYSSPNEIWETF